MDQFHPNKVRQFLFLTVIILLFWVIWQQMIFMFSAFLGAVTLYVLVRKRMFRLIMENKWPRWLVALLAIVVSLIVIVLPFAWIIKVLIQKVEPYIRDTRPLLLMLGSIDTYLQAHFRIEVFTEANIAKAVNTATSLAPKLLGSTLAIVTNLAIMYFVLYFMIVKCSDMELWLRRNMPLKNRNSEKVLTEIREMVKANAIGIPMLAVIQGVIAMIGYMIFGVKDPLLWGIITGLCSVVPIVGTAAAWLPLTLYLFATGRQGAGLGLLVWGALVIGISDNVFRLLLQKRLADVHPLITIFGVIIGINIFGFLGLIFGPLLLSIFTLLVRIYLDEFGKKPEEPAT
ncbi:MAG: AI-2E family transporter [Chitinophagaceae bacterium]